MSKFEHYRDAFETVKLERSDSGILQMTLHKNGGPYMWDFHGTVRDPDRSDLGGTHSELGRAFYEVSRDPENKVVIMTGTGDIFAGPPADQWLFPRGDAPYWEVLRSTATALLTNLLDINVPMISIINGPAYRHAELPFGADIVLAADDAMIQDSAHFPNRTVPGDGIALLLPFLMGWNRGRYWVLTGQKLSAQEMKEYGLVAEVLPREQLLPRAWELAEQMITNNPLVLRYTRMIMTAPIKMLVQQYFGYSFALEALASTHESTGKVGFTWQGEAPKGQS